MSYLIRNRTWIAVLRQWDVAGYATGTREKLHVVSGPERHVHARDDRVVCAVLADVVCSYCQLQHLFRDQVDFHYWLVPRDHQTESVAQYLRVIAHYDR